MYFIKLFLTYLPFNDSDSILLENLRQGRDELSPELLEILEILENYSYELGYDFIHIEFADISNIHINKTMYQKDFSGGYKLLSTKQLKGFPLKKKNDRIDLFNVQL
jgi:hypothetical protein